MKFINKLKSCLAQDSSPVKTPEAPVGTLEPTIRDIVSSLEKGEAFDYAERGEFEDGIYESRIGNNLWTPRQHPAVWVLISVRGGDQL